MPLGSGVKTNIRTGDPILETAGNKKQLRRPASARPSAEAWPSGRHQRSRGPGVEAMIEQMILHASMVLAEGSGYMPAFWRF